MKHVEQSAAGVLLIMSVGNVIVTTRQDRVFTRLSNDVSIPAEDRILLQFRGAYPPQQVEGWHPGYMTGRAS